MNEIEQMRKEINELRERIACLEKRPVPVPIDLSKYSRQNMPPAGWEVVDARKYSSTPVWLNQNQKKEPL